MLQQTLGNSEELDEEFKNILKQIHPYFKALKSTNNDMSLCQKWLHKLFKTDNHEMKLRNAYASELLKQLKNGKLNEPFTKLPKNNGLLLPLPIRTHMSMQNFHVDSKTTTNKKLYNSVWDVINFQSIADVDYEYSENWVNSNGHSKEEIKEKDDLNDKQISDFIDVPDNSKELQQRQQTADKSECGDDWCALNRETNMKLESFEKRFEELQMKHELLVYRLHAIELQADANTSNTNQMVTAFIAELTKMKRDLDAMNEREAVERSEDLANFNVLAERTDRVDRHIDQFVAEARGLRSLMEDACDHREIVGKMMETIEHVKGQRGAQLDEENGRIGRRIDAFEDKVDELQARMDFNSSRRDAAAAAAARPPKIDYDDDDDDDGDDGDDDNGTIISQ